MVLKSLLESFLIVQLTIEHFHTSDVELLLPMSMELWLEEREKSELAVSTG